MGTKKHSLSDSLFSKAQQKVLRLLFMQENRGFHTNEIIRITHMGVGAVHRELQKLAEVGLITVNNIGNQKHYQANKNSPVFNELRSIILKTFGLVDVLQEVLAPLSNQINVAFIYGSIAKHEDTVMSDIDLMVISDALTYADLFNVITHAESQIGRTVNPTCYSITEWKQKRAIKNHFIERVIKQDKIFLIGSEDDLYKF